MPETKQFFAKLLGTRPTWPDDMTKDEEKVMGKHFYYLQDLIQQKKVLMTGPVFDMKFGLVVVQTTSRAEADEILKYDPSIMAGLHTYELSEMRVSLDAHSVPASRYVEDPTDRIIEKEVVVSTALDDVWHAWTTTEGVNSFFSPNAKVELRVGGPFEIYFDVEAEYGSRGSEDCKILSYLPKQMLSFEWNAPPDFGALRYIYTRIILFFDESEPGKIKISMSHVGWGEGEEWDQVYDYFDRAWSYVLANFEKRFTEGPIDW